MNGNTAYRSIEAVIAELTLEATSPVEMEKKEEKEEWEELMGVADSAPEVYREGDTVTAELVEQKPQRREYASAVILGGVSPKDIYREGDLVSRIPAIGLASVSKGSVELIDREGEIYELKLRR